MAYDERISDLFNPLTVRSMTIRNRFAMAPMTRAASPDGIPGANVAHYYARRASGGVGLIITEGVRLPDPSAGFPDSIPTLAGEAALGGWRAVTNAVHARGAVIAAQLWHQGAERDERDGVVALSPSGVNGAGEPKGRALRTDELAGLAETYATSARNARAVGFDAVELHGAHGYLSTNSSGRERICVTIAMVAVWAIGLAFPPRSSRRCGPRSVRTIRSSSASHNGNKPTTPPRSSRTPLSYRSCWGR